MSSSDLDIETISQIFPLSDSESSENLLATGAGEDQTPESGPEIETEQEQAMTEKSADVSLKPSDIVKTSDDAEEGLCDQEAEEDSSSAVQTPESGPGTEAMSKAQEEIQSLRRENKDLKDKLSNLQRCIKRYEEFADQMIESKNSLEDKLYAKFLPVLNAKKAEILRLQKLLSPDPEPDYGEDVDTDVDEEDGESEKKRQKM